uniref:Uncharacterized protein n=1 Tax=Arundo donax TaxID=35708 RepID=A0A0A9QHY1_ARUDO
MPLRARMLSSSA